MPGPVATEQAFRVLSASLGFPASPSWHLHALARFFRQIAADRPEAEAYLLELADDLRRLSCALDPAGWRPEELHALPAYLEQARDHASLLHEVEALGQAIDHLKEATALSWAWIGRPDRALDVLFGDERKEQVTGLETITEEAARSPREHLEQALEVTARTAPAHYERLARLAVRWDRSLPVGRFAAFVPVVEVPAVNRTQEPIPVLRRVKVEVFRWRKDEDRLRLDAATYGGQGAIDQYVEAPVRAARRLLAETRPRLRQGYFEGQAAFARPQALHEGRSASLALAVLFYMAALQQGEQRLRYRMQRGACLTGDLTEEGRVEAVEGLTLKVQAAFFSGVTCLAVPKVQLAEAEAERDGWHRRYPQRRLDVVGVAHLREVFYDRRLVAEERVGRVQHLAQWLWRQKFSLGSLAVILVLALLVGKLLYGPLDTNPVAGEFSGASLIVKNAAGEVLETIPLLSDNHCPNARQCVAFIDVDQDGQNEIIWADRGQHSAGGTHSYIRCKSLGQRDYLWSRPLTFDLEFPHQPEASGPNYRAIALVAGDFDENNRPEIIASLVHYAYFPGLVVKLDPATGEISSDYYVHTGWLFTLTTVDLNGDGVEEILLGGTNNALQNTPCLVVLDPRQLSGHGPLRPRYQVAGMERAREVAYLRIPRGQLGELRRVSVANPRVTRLQINQPSQTIRAFSQEGNWTDPLTKRKVPLYLLLHFNFDLEPLQVGTSSQYDQLIEQLIDDGELDRRPDAVYKQQFLQRIRYWNGDEWQTEPTWNRRWLASEDSLAAGARR